MVSWPKRALSFRRHRTLRIVVSARYVTSRWTAGRRRMIRGQLSRSFERDDID